MTSATSITLLNETPYQYGSYTAYISAFNTGSLNYGSDYNEQISLSASQFPSAMTATWSFPAAGENSIKSFIAVDYGDYYNTTALTPVDSTIISAQWALNETFNFAISGNIQGFDVITDMFLTGTPGNNATNSAEVEIFLHTPNYSKAWFSSLTQLGTIQISGIEWSVASGSNNGIPDYIFMPSTQNDITSNTIDIKSMLQYLVTNGGLNDSLYFNGLSLGVETNTGSGSFALNNFSVSYSTNLASTNPTIELTDATGQTINGTIYTTDASLDGHANPNTKLTVYDGLGVLATITSDSNGNWSYDPSSISNGYHDFTIAEATTTGSTSSDSIAVMFNNSPQTITESILAGSARTKAGTYLTTPTINGYTSANTDVAIYDNNNYIGNIMSNSSGYWSYHLTSAAAGVNNIMVSSENLYGSSATASIHFKFI